MRVTKICLIAGTALTMALTGCSDRKWSAMGCVDGAAGKSIIVEAPNGRGGWYPVDTVDVASDGTFKVTGEPFGHPELLRLNLDGAQAYFPVDSVEDVVITAQASDFQGTAKIGGSVSADRMQQVNDLIAAAVRTDGPSAVADDVRLKRKLAEIILADPSDITAYYLVFHNVGGRRLFSPAVKSDLRVIGAVANAYTQFRPSDPRTALLKELFLSSKAALMPSQPVAVEAAAIGYPELSLIDEKGTTRKLSDAVASGKVVLVNFTAYTVEGSPAVNVALNKIYESKRADGLQIYQVGVDPDEFQWRQSAGNLPWITVYNAPKDAAGVLAAYNVTTLPVTFIISGGEVRERVDDISKLSAAVAKYI